MTRGSTWRRLTVAENQSTQPPEVAVGYRVASGNDQWLVYRSLAPAANRTVLGHNLITELLIAQFGRDGQVQSLIEIGVRIPPRLFCSLRPARRRLR